MNFLTSRNVPQASLSEPASQDLWAPPYSFWCSPSWLWLSGKSWGARCGDWKHSYWTPKLLQGVGLNPPDSNNKAGLGEGTFVLFWRWQPRGFSSKCDSPHWQSVGKTMQGGATSRNKSALLMSGNLSCGGLYVASRLIVLSTVSL